MRVVIFRSKLIVLLLFVVFGFFYAASLDGQTSGRMSCEQKRRSADTQYPSERLFVHNLVCDQKQIWTSPFRIRLKDAQWLVPFAGVTTGLIVTDRPTSAELSRGSNINLSNHIADTGVALAGAGVVGLYGLGRLQSNDHLRETGVAGRGGNDQFGDHRYGA